LEPVKSGSVSISIMAFETLYYANALSGVPFVKKLFLHSSELLEDVTVSIQVVGPNGSMSRPFELQVATLGQKALEFSNLQMSFDANLMYQVLDPQAGKIEVSVLIGDSQVASATWPIEILPANFWRAGDEDSEDAYQALASFAQPNHPYLRKILDDAVLKLRNKHPDGSLSGYQNPSTVDPLVESIYSSIQDLGLTYSNPPASWSGGGGQKVRTAQEILDEKVGTCLDTTMLFAGCLEQAGLAPIIFLIPGHAFVGYWTAEFSMRYEGHIPRTNPIQSVDSLANYLDLGHIRLVETTSLTKTVDFASAQKEALLRLDDAEAFGRARAYSVGIDVLGCRRSDNPIHPLPARVLNQNGTVEVHEYKPPVVDLEMLRERFAERDAVSGQTVSINVPPVVRKWLDSLLDLSLRNPLINFANKRSAVRLLIPKGSLGLLEDLLQNEKLFQLATAPTLKGSDGKAIPVFSDNQRGEVPADPSLENFLNANLSSPQGVISTEITQPEAFVSRMRRTASEAKAITQETGTNGLYLALGSLSWKAGKAEVESPLILIPVTVVPKNRGTAFMLQIEDSGVTPNFSLVEKLKIEHKLNLSGLANLQTDQFGIDIDGTLKYVREELVKAGHQDFKVSATATLGFFNFSSYRLWKDLLDNWKRFEQNPLVKHLVNTPGEAFQDRESIEEDVDLDQLVAELPIPADGSQALAIASALQGKTFVLQGPPGTGKSQTITNLLSKALDEGKRVLFVAEKRDALNVVKERLDAAGLGAFSLDLHDKNSTSKAIKQQLAEVIDILIDPDKLGFETAIADYQAALTPLNNYRTQIHEEGDLGESVFSAMEKYLAISTDEILELPGEFVSSTSAEALDEILQATKSIAELGRASGAGSANPWSLSNRTSLLETADLNQIKETIQNLDSQIKSISRIPDVASFIEVSRSFGQLGSLAAVGVKSASSETRAFLGAQASKEVLNQIKEALGTFTDLASKQGFDISRVSKVNFDEFDMSYRIAVATNPLLRGVKIGGVVKQLNAVLGLTKVINKANLASSLDELSLLKNKGDDLASRLSKLAGFESEGPINFYFPSEREKLAERLEELAALDNFLRDAPIDRSSASDVLSRLSEDQKLEIVAFTKSLSALTTALGVNETSAARWAGSSTFGSALLMRSAGLVKDARETGFAQLLRWNSLLKASEPLVAAGLGEPLELLLTGEISFDVANSALRKGFYQGLFRNLMIQKGLNTFDGASVDNYVRQLTDAHERLRVRLPKVLGAELLSRRGFDGSMKVGAIGDLILSVKQGRSNISLKDMLSRHWDVIAKMTPCVLASPDSAVRFLSATQEPFDLVVFDEASQIRVANSIGALGRAKAAVVVGDSQQMPPTSVGIAKTSLFDDEESEQVEEDFGEPESILTQCEIARVPDIMLSWHYRSEDESLIAFSNHHYYEGRLSTFPSPTLDQSSRRLSLDFVGGQFIRSSKEAPQGTKAPLRTNPREAAAIVEDIIKRLEDPLRQNESIAIVTLNEQQKVLVTSLLSDSKNKAVENALENGVGGEEILIKALEKVQGSERDVVLISVAFSPAFDDPKNLPLNFGPIIHQGGHRRLNVAITRARKEVKIFSSFPAKMLADRNPASRGLQDLAKFMSMAGGSTNISDEISVRETRLDRHRTDIAKALREAGLLVIEEVGMSEFKVDLALADSKKPNQAVLGILLDGKRWSQRRTVTDRDALPVAMLTDRMGWSAVERIWLPNWLRDRGGEIERIKKAFETAKTLKPRDARSSVKMPAEPIFTQRSELGEGGSVDSVNPFDALLESTPTWSPMQIQIVAGQDYMDLLHVPEVQKAVRGIVAVLTNIEGPVSPERLAKVVASCFGFTRVVESRIKAINGVGFPGHDRGIENFLFPVGVGPSSYRDWKISNESSGRKLSEVSIYEIANAMVAIARVAQGVAPEQLVKEASRVFGLQKVSKDSSLRLEKALALAVQSERLIQDGHYFKAKD
jgi:hypothetical protein